MIAILLAVLLVSQPQVAYIAARSGSTVVGVDNDRDGIRESVQQYILETYPSGNQASLRAALLEVARSSQILLRTAQEDPSNISDAMVSYLDARAFMTLLEKMQ